MKITKFEQQTSEEIKNMTNEELLDLTIEEASGDDYDGCFTKKGWMRFCLLKEELKSRLANWISEDKKCKS